MRRNNHSLKIKVVKTKPVRRMKRPQLQKKLKRRKSPEVMSNDPTMVMFHHESTNLACIINKIWNGNADTRLVNA